MPWHSHWPKSSRKCGSRGILPQTDSGGRCSTEATGRDCLHNLVQQTLRATPPPDSCRQSHSDGMSDFFAQPTSKQVRRMCAGDRRNVKRGDIRKWRESTELERPSSLSGAIVGHNSRVIPQMHQEPAARRCGQEGGAESASNVKLLGITLKFDCRLVMAIKDG